MSYLRIIPAALIASVLFFDFPPILGVIQLSDVMTQSEQQKTGISKLSTEQKKQLENWLNDKFVLKQAADSPTIPPMPTGPTPPPSLKDLYVSENLDGGGKLQLSNGDTYEIHPDDRDISSAWLLPSNVTLMPSKNPDYPFTITNTVTQTSVKAKKYDPSAPLSSNPSQRNGEPLKQTTPLQKPGVPNK